MTDIFATDEANLFTIQMRFWGMGDIVVANAVLEVYQ